MHWLILLLLGIFAAHAHEPGLSSAEFRPTQDGLELVLTFAVADVDNLLLLDTDGDGKVSQLEFQYGRPRVAALPSQVAAVEIDGNLLTNAEPALRMNPLDNIEFIVRYPQKLGSNFIYRCEIFPQLPRGHRQFASLRDETGKVMVERLLTAEHNELVYPPSAPKVTFWGFLTLGIEHILTGYDHLLFLFALLLVTRRFVSAVKIVTCFTIAHSITLALATFNVVNIPSRVIEPLIAATIVYVGIENIILKGEPKRRWLLTFAFGLIHGFGFASVLRELGISSGSSGIVMPLFSFNLGVEIGQISVAAILLPFIWRFSRKPDFALRWVPACSVLVALAGGYWFIVRVWGV
ncbi:MAG TPA: HupE/UreJ family protein [Verrucomicrobiae bacterium]|nr:HupE/UreJ family protein [Verrucomicrobiae bacterium]